MPEIEGEACGNSSISEIKCATSFRNCPQAEAALLIKGDGFIEFKLGGEREPRLHLASRSRENVFKRARGHPPALKASRRRRISSANSASSCSPCKLISSVSRSLLPLFGRKRQRLFGDDFARSFMG